MVDALLTADRDDRVRTVLSLFLSVSVRPILCQGLLPMTSSSFFSTPGTVACTVALPLQVRLLVPGTW